MSTISSFETLVNQHFESQKIEIYRRSDRDEYYFYFKDVDTYRTPGERAVDDAWERNQ